MVKCFLALTCLLSISCHAHHEFFLESKYLKTIGDAVVHVTHDRFFDRYHWGMQYNDKSSDVFPPMGVSIVCSEVSSFGSSFLFSEAPEESSEPQKLQYRFDDGDSKSVDVTFSALNDRHASAKFDQKEFTEFLEGLATAAEITFSVGDAEDTLELKNMKKAVLEYRQILANSYIIEFDSSDSEDEEAEPDEEKSENDELVPSDD